MAEENLPRRLCSEIKLFDLCTKNLCGSKDGRFCLDKGILAKFETISEEDIDYTEQLMIDEAEDFEDSDYTEYEEDAYDDSDEDDD
ncbi:MAG: hypothetical protein WCG31_00700 [Deltaproteobacteria bacterium]